VSKRRLGSAIAWGLVVVLTVFALTGCWDITTPEQLTVPVLLGIDWSHRIFRVTVEADAPQLMHSPGSSSGSGQSPPTWILRGENPSFVRAIRQTGLEFPDYNPTTLAHLRVVILGQSALARPALTVVLNRLIRAPFLHRTFWVLATPQSAQSIATAVNPIGPDPVDAIEHALKAASHNGWAVRTRFYVIAESLLNAPDLAFLIPTVTLQPNLGKAPGSRFIFTGAEVLTAQGLVGVWSRSQVSTWSLLTNRPVSVLFTVTNGSTRWVFQTAHSHARIRWTAHGLVIHATIPVSLEESSTLPTVSRVPVHQLAAQAAKQWAARIASLVRWCQRHRADVFQLETQYQAQHPFAQPLPPPTWADRFARQDLSVTVHVMIRGSGALVLTP
jgi:hypothetical protein